MQIVAFDFAAKRERTLDERDKPAQPEPNLFHWIVAAPEEAAAAAFVRKKKWI